MKKLILSAVLLGIFAVSAFAVGGDEIPASVKTKFASEYGTAKKVKWDTEDGKFEASFELNGVEMSATYDGSANKVETESEIEVSALPKGVSEYLAKNHAGQKIKEAAKIVDAKGTVTYEAEVKEGDLIFDSNGNFLSKKDAKDEKDEEDDDKKEGKK